MVMLTRTWTCKTHEDFGSLGWMPDWQPGFDPLSGMAVAHDIMEHFENDDGNAAGEMMAFGAMYLVRIEGCYQMPQGSCTDDNLDIETAEVMGRVMCGDQYLPPLAFDTTGDEDLDRDIERMTCRAMTVYNDGSIYDIDEHEPIKRCQAMSYAAWVKKGYVEACKRYGDTCPYRLSTMFTEIERFADQALKHAQEGEKITVSIGAKTGDFETGYEIGYETLEELYPFDEEDC